MSDFNEENGPKSVTPGIRDTSTLVEADGNNAEPDEHEQELRDYKDIDLPPPDPTKVAKVQEVLTQQGLTKTHIKARKSAFVHNLIYLDGYKFDFEGRNYLIPIYDRPDRQILLKTARQVEKCQDGDRPVLLSNGKEKKAREVVTGDILLGISEEGKQEKSQVIASESNGEKECLEIKTRTGSVQVVTKNHPFRKLLSWEVSENLEVGDKIASLRTLGEFGELFEPLAPLIGCMVGDGSYTKNSVRFTCKNPVLQEEFERLYGLCKYSVDRRSGTRNYYVSKNSQIIKYLISKGCFGNTAVNKKLPEEVFDFDKPSTALLLKFLWATDGHCKNTSSSKTDLVFSSSSEKLVDQVRSLLRKFGILTTKRNYKPKKGNNTFIIRVITRDSIDSFWREIAPIPGKPFEAPQGPSNSNLDTLPREMNEVIKIARIKNNNYWKRSGLQSKGIRQGFEYCPTYEKVKKIQKYINDPIVERTLNSDIFWDEIVSIKEVGKRETWAIQTENETYVSDSIVNHNTTFLGNNLVVTSVCVPYNKSLYVSPSHTQTRQFSNEKLRPAIEKSPLIRKYFQDTKVSHQVFEKGFTNGSYCFLRSAFRSADRARGISARNLCLDEIQDMYISEIPVIMECTSHFPDANVLMAGTPKSFDNPIEVYWNNTTQNEWLVKCEACNHWNFLDDTNIAPTEMYESDKLPPGPVCKKCMHPLQVSKHGRWMSLSTGKQIAGYRIPQLMVPWIIGLKEQWRKLLWKRDNYPLGQFYNEVLGLSYDLASKPITRAELIECCGDYKLWRTPFTQDVIRKARRMSLVGGIDWGEGNDGAGRTPSGKLKSASYTVFTIGHYVNPKQFKVLFAKKYTGKEVEPDYIVKDVVQIVKALGVKLLGVDWGHGWGVNNQLVRALGAERVVQFQYLPKQRERMKWDPIGFKYQLQRNINVSEMFVQMKNGGVIFPKWNEIEPVAKDILSIYTEFDEYKKEMKYDHRQSDPDDFFHSLLYGKLAGDIFLGRRPR